MATFIQDDFKSGGTGQGAYILEGISAAAVPLTVKAYTGQTANVLEVKNAAGTVLFSVDNSGNVTYLGDEYVTDALTVNGNASITGTLGVTGATTLSSTFGVSGAATFSSGITVTGDSSIEGTTTIHSLRVEGDLNLQSGYIRSLYSANLHLLPGPSCITIVGDAGTTSHTLNTNDDLFVTGRLEVDGFAYFDGGSSAGVSFTDDTPLYFGASNDASITWNTTQTVDGWYFGTSTAQNTIIIAEIGDIVYDFAHGAQTNPTVYIQSATQSATQWGSLTHNQTDFLISSGGGAVRFAPATNVTATLPATGKVFIDGTTSRTGTTEALDIDATIDTTTATDDVPAVTIAATRAALDTGGTYALQASVTTGNQANGEFSSVFSGTYNTGACASATSNAAVFYAGTSTVDAQCNDYGIYIASGYDTAAYLAGPVEAITTLSMSGDLTMSGNTVNITHSGTTSLTITSTSGTVGIEGVVFTGDAISSATTLDMAGTLTNVLGATDKVFINGATTRTGTSELLDIDATIDTTTATDDVTCATIIAGRAALDTGGTRGWEVTITTGDMANAEWSYCYGGSYVTSACVTATANSAVFYAGTSTVDAQCNDYGIYVSTGYDYAGYFDGTIVVTGQITSNLGFMPDADDGAYLGQAGTAFSDLFLAEGGVINWDSGDVTLTQTGNQLALAGGTFTDGTATLNAGAWSGVTTLGLTAGITQTTTVTGTLYDMQLETEWTGGTLINADFGGATAQATDMLGIVLDFNTNLAGVADKDVTGYIVKTPILTQSTADTTTYIGYSLPTAGALVQDTLGGTIAWRGVNIQCPNITQTTGAVTSYGIYVNGGTVTSGTQWAILVDAGNVRFDGELTLGNDVDNVSGKINFIASDGDAADISITTSDALAFANAAGGYTFDGPVSGITTLGLTGDITVTSAATTTNALAITADALTSGGMISAVSNSADITARKLLFVHNDNAAATGANPVYIQNDSTGYCILAYPNNAAGQGITISTGAVTTGIGMLIGSFNSGTTFTGFQSTANSTAITSGRGLLVNLASSGTVIANKTGDWASITSSRTDARTTGMTADDYDVASIIRTSVTTGVGGTMTAAGSVLYLQNISTQTAGTLTDTAIVLEIAQAANSSGAAIGITNAGTGNDITGTNATWSITKGGVVAASSIGVTGTRIANGFFTDLAVTNTITGSITGNAATVTVAAEASDTSCSVLFATDVSGSLAPKTNIGLTFNASTAVLTATGFAGPLTGDVTGNCTGTAATVTGVTQASITTCANLVSIGTISTGVWQGTTIKANYLQQVAADLGDADITVDFTNSNAGNVTNLTIDGTFTAGFLAATTLSGSITFGENTALIHDNALSLDGKYCGEVVAGTAGAILAFGDLCYLDPTDSKWELTDANSAAAADGDARGLIGICVLAAAENAATTILLRGMVRADTAFPVITINGPVYISETAGDVTMTQPVTTDAVIRTIGQGFDANTIYFNPSPDWITHT